MSSLKFKIVKDLNQRSLENGLMSRAIGVKTIARDRGQMMQQKRQTFHLKMIHGLKKQ